MLSDRMQSPTVLKTHLDLPVRRGKVRDVYDLGDQLLLVSTDRISAFDWILPTGIPEKGRVLTQISKFWFQCLGEDHHLITDDLASETARQAGVPVDIDLDIFGGRTIVVRKTKVVPIECVVRGYLSGSGWKEYQSGGMVCGISLPAGLVESSKLESPIFTPATKAESGHDENVSFERMIQAVGSDVAHELRDRSLALYEVGAQVAAQRGILIADTKFEWGCDGQRLILIDEVFTPDSSRFWPADQYQPGGAQVSFDKQFVRDWLETTDWDKDCEPPMLPDDIVEKTRDRYLEALRIITGSGL
jgi:phosphoribosylaminoimidazole-succinocarboxamide synthase